VLVKLSKQYNGIAIEENRRLIVVDKLFAILLLVISLLCQIFFA